MANQEHLKIIKRGNVTWNEWREKHPWVRLDLSAADLSYASLIDADLSYADLSYADLSYANLSAASLSYAHLIYASLSYANLSGVDLSKANLSDANLSDANLSGADLSGANLSKAHALDTIFGKNDLRQTRGLETITHEGPSTIGIDTLMRSQGNIPDVFLKGVGVSDEIIEYAKSLTGRAIEYYTCFISYSSKDQNFVERLYADLQNKGVRCWYAPEDMKTGDKMRQRIDESIRLYDKLLLVLSEHSINSKWVEFEVEAALDKEGNKNVAVLFPVRLDAVNAKNTTSWAAHIQRTRHITDFSKWERYNSYQKAFNRLLRDLQAKDAPRSR